MPDMLPLPLDYAQSKELRKLLHAAVIDAVQTFTARHVVKDGAGTPIGGPDPRMIQREVGFHLTRILADHDVFDGAFSAEAIDPRAYDARFRELETELVGKTATFKGTLNGAPETFKVTAVHPPTTRPTRRQGAGKPRP